jgi:hypothetical protein
MPCCTGLKLLPLLWAGVVRPSVCSQHSVQTGVRRLCDQSLIHQDMALTTVSHVRTLARSAVELHMHRVHQSALLVDAVDQPVAAETPSRVPVSSSRPRTDYIAGE